MHYASYAALQAGNAWEKLLQITMENTTRIITVVIILITLIGLIAVAAAKDLRKYSRTVFDVKLRKTRACLITKFISEHEEAGDGRHNGETADLFRSEKHYLAHFSVPGKKRGLTLELKSGEWEELREGDEGLLEYSGVVLVAFTPDKKSEA